MAPKSAIEIICYLFDIIGRRILIIFYEKNWKRVLICMEKEKSSFIYYIFQLGSYSIQVTHRLLTGYESIRRNYGQVTQVTQVTIIKEILIFL